MPHMVIYRNADGSPAYHQTEALEDAVRFVEQIRNEQGVNDSRLFRMEEVPIEFKTYYRVEVAAGETGTQAPAAPAAPEAQAAPVIPPLAEGAPQPVEADAAAAGSGRFGLFAKG
ncbi:MAG: hypothetical protein ACLGHT_10360 [Acidimicrobiia bacterium]